MSLRDAIQSDVVDSWASFGVVKAPYVIGSFTVVGVVGKQGAGKTTLAINILLRRLYRAMQVGGVWRPGDGADPMDDGFNPFANVTDVVNGRAVSRRLFSELMARKHKVVSPLEVYRFLVSPRPATAGLIFDEVPLWSKDVTSWWRGKKQKAVEFLRQVLVNIRGVTSYLMILAQDVHLVPAPLRYPLDVVVDLHRFEAEGQEGGVLKGVVYGTVKMRNVYGARTPRSESSYYKVYEFRLPVYNSAYLMELDLAAKRRALGRFLAGAFGPDVAPEAKPVMSPPRPQTSYYGERFILQLASGQVLHSDQGSVAVYSGVKWPVRVCAYLRYIFPFAVAECEGDNSAGTLTVTCTPGAEPCHERLKNLASLYLVGRQ
jgi:hypothetical protein